MRTAPGGLGAARVGLALFVGAFAGTCACGQTSPPAAGSAQSGVAAENRTTRDYNQRLQQLVQQFDAASSNSSAIPQAYRIGPEDVVNISVYGASDLSGEARVSANGSISLPLIGSVHAAGLTSQELESVLEELLRRTYMKDPHVTVFVKKVESHPVSVFGAVQKPGVFQVRSAKSLIEVLSLAQGLAVDAGDTVIVMRHPGDPASPAVADQEQSAAPTVTEVDLKRTPAVPQPPDRLADSSSIRISLKKLLDSGDARYNVPVYPGDVVEVTRAGIVYVVGEVNKPGGYVLKTNENISVLQAIALAEGETHTASGKHARIIRTNSVTGVRTEIPINLNKILSGHAPDPLLQAKDIVFVPNSAGKAALYRSTEGIVATVGGAAVYRW